MVGRKCFHVYGGRSAILKQNMEIIISARNVGPYILQVKSKGLDSRRVRINNTVLWINLIPSLLTKTVYPLTTVPEQLITFGFGYRYGT